MISKCSTVVLSKTKFSEFEALPENADLNKVFLAGYSFDETGVPYNVKVQAAAISANYMTANVIKTLYPEGDDGYKWVNIGGYDICEFDTLNYKPYVEIQAVCECVDDDCLRIKISDETEVGTAVKFLVKCIPSKIKTIEFWDANGMYQVVYEHEEDTSWNCFFEVLKTSNSYLIFNISEYL